MDKEQRNKLRRAVEKARKLLEDEVAGQLEGIYNILSDGAILSEIPKGTDPVIRERLLEVVAHHRARGATAKEAVTRATREMAFTILNRFVALRMAEQRGLVRECISQGPSSDGIRELADGAPGMRAVFADGGYRLILEAIMDELSLGLKVLFDRRSPTGLIWPGPVALDELLEILNAPELAPIWAEDEAIGWVYQYFHPKEERESMREASATPRDSYELAVRNQFFTPRYVVELLADNTLGRIWYEMRKGSTALKDQCRYLVYQPNEVFLEPGEEPPQADGNNEDRAFVAHRPMRDPRDLKILDPACGSGHFLLYCFGLLQTIYEEAWADEAQPVSDTTGARLRQDYSSLDALRRAVPVLILKHNLYGIDIDPRAAQIAALALWLRAQRAYSELGLKSAARPAVQRTNIVVAEPMPGEKELLTELTDSLRPPLLGQIVDAVFEKMRFAGDMGPLLRIEKEISIALRKAKEAWLSSPRQEQLGLFPEQAAPKQVQLDLSGITDEAFWQEAEARIYGALQHYSESATNGAGYRRSLFVHDAAQGFAFIDACRQRYDVVLMNPPFGEPPNRVEALVSEQWPVSKGNLYIAFVGRAGELTTPDGLVGAITDATFVHQTKYQEYRENLLGEGLLSLQMLVANGWGVLDAYVETSCVVLSPSKPQKIVTFDMRDTDSRPEKLAVAIIELRSGRLTKDTRVIEPNTFIHIPKSVLAFWLPSQILRMYRLFQPLDPSYVDARCGMSSSDNSRFYKVWWEVNTVDIGADKIWRFLANGGPPCPFFRQQIYLVNYERDGYAVKSKVAELYGSWSRTIINEPYYMQAGFTFGKRTESFSTQFLPKNHVFSNEGQAIFPKDGRVTNGLLAYLNSSLVAYLLNSIAGQHKEAGYVGSIPSPPNEFLLSSIVSERVQRAYSLLLKYAKAVPESQVFLWPLHPAPTAGTSIKELVQVIHSDSREFCKVLIENDAALENAVGFKTQDSRPWEHRCWNVSDAIFGCSEQELARTIAVDLVGYLFGCVVGRWDVRLPKGLRSAPSEPDPLNALPICPPGMLTGPAGLPAKMPPSEYPIDFPMDGVLVDDQSGEEMAGDLSVVPRIRHVFGVIWSERVAEMERELVGLLGSVDLRAYFRRPAAFFADHLSRYSKSRRKAPIYWPLSTVSGSYTVWVYYPRLTADTLYKIASEHVGPKIGQVEDRVAQLEGDQTKGEGRGTARIAKELAELTELLGDLKELRDELLRVAKLPYKPDLNDGVQITAAPLWRLFRLPKWRAELEKTWKALERGDYDWAHLAYAIWPDRVKDKCMTDKSLAIAHGLEQLYQERASTETTGGAQTKKARSSNMERATKKAKRI